jgi:hypothetical protein
MNCPFYKSKGQTQPKIIDYNFLIFKILLSLKLIWGVQTLGEFQMWQLSECTHNPPNKPDFSVMTELWRHTTLISKHILILSGEKKIAQNL